MKANQNIIVKDILTSEARVIFIFESPHTNEIKTGVPLSGDSGKVFSKALLSNTEKPAGFQIAEGGIPFSILNTFQNGLQLDSGLKELKASIDLINYKSLTFRSYKFKLVEAFNSYYNVNKLTDNYKKRLTSALNISQLKPKIVICGLIAQTFFEYVFEVSRISLGYPKTLYILDTDIEILYVEHPSPKNSNTYWNVKNANKSQILITFCN